MFWHDKYNVIVSITEQLSILCKMWVDCGLLAGSGMTVCWLVIIHNKLSKYYILTTVDAKAWKPDGLKACLISSETSHGGSFLSFLSFWLSDTDLVIVIGLAL